MAPIVRPGRGSQLFPREVSADIFTKAAEASLVQRLAPRTTLPTAGKAMPFITGQIEAAWVEETGRKPVSDLGADFRVMDPHKIAVVVPFSEEYVRDVGTLYNVARDKIGEAFGRKFDDAALRGVDSPFGTGNNLAATTKAVELGTATAAAGGYYGDLVAGLSLLVEDGKDLTAFAFDKRLQPRLLTQFDTTGRPIFTAGVADNGLPGTVLGVPAGFSKNLAGGTTLRGIGGDWTQCAYGVAVDITFSVSDQATLQMEDGTLLNLWQHNMIAVRAEAEYGFIVADADAFVRYIDAA